MPAVPISTRALFPSYTSAADAKSHGIVAPAFDPAKPIKSWIDPNPQADEDGNVTYDAVLACEKSGKPLERNGQPYTRKMIISAAEAQALNVKTSDASQTPVGASTRPVPIRFDPETEVLAYTNPPGMPFRGSVIVRPINEVPEPTYPAVPFTTEHDRLIKAIALKVGAE